MAPDIEEPEEGWPSTGTEQAPAEEPVPTTERKRSAAKENAPSPKKKKVRPIDIDLPDAPFDGMLLSKMISIYMYTIIHIYMGSIKLKLASKTKNKFYSSNMYLTYLES